MKKIAIIVAVALSVTVTACSSDEPAPAAEETSAATSSPTVAPTGLKETCPEIEAALPDDMSDLTKLNDFTTRLAELNTAGDTETKNAIELLDPATTDLRLAIANDAAAGEVLEARRSWLDSIDVVAERCAAAGSSALQ